MKPIAKILWLTLATMLFVSLLTYYLIRNNYKCDHYFGPSGPDYLYYPTVSNGIYRAPSFSSLPYLAPFSAWDSALSSMAEPDIHRSQLLNQADFGSCDNDSPNTQILSFYHLSVNDALLQRFSPRLVSTNEYGKAEFIGIDTLSHLKIDYDAKNLPTIPNFVFKEFRLQKELFHLAGFFGGDPLYIDYGNRQIIIISSNFSSRNPPELEGDYEKFYSWQY